MKKILIMGLPGSGKTHLANALFTNIKNKSVLWLNADSIRTLYNDWDFSYEGRIRQANRMKYLSDCSNHDIIIVDFVAPLSIMRNIYNPDILVWINTLETGRFEDTNKIFEKPLNADIIIDNYNTNFWINKILELI